MDLTEFRDLYVKERNRKMRESKRGFINIKIDLEDLGFCWCENQRTVMILKVGKNIVNCI